MALILQQQVPMYGLKWSMPYSQRWGRERKPADLLTGQSKVLGNLKEAELIYLSEAVYFSSLLPDVCTMLYTLRKCKLCRYMTVTNKISPRYVRTHEWLYWFRPRGHLSQYPASKVTVCGCQGESRNRTNVSNTFPKQSPRFSLFSAEISQAVCVYSKTPSGLSITYMSTWIHVCFLHPWHLLAKSSTEWLFVHRFCVECFWV